MPHYRNPFEKGDLFIKFEVQFPENNWISPEKLMVSVRIDYLQVLICVQSANSVNIFQSVGF